MWEAQHWTEERTFKLLDPYKNTTKSQLVKMYIEKGYNPNDILESYSCYEGEETPCGICKPCVRKYIALENNNIEIPEGYFKNNPLDAEWIYQVLPQMEVMQYRGLEDMDFLRVLKKKGRI